MELSAAAQGPQVSTELPKPCGDTAGQDGLRADAPAAVSLEGLLQARECPGVLGRLHQSSPAQIWEHTRDIPCQGHPTLFQAAEGSQPGQNQALQATLTFSALDKPEH